MDFDQHGITITPSALPDESLASLASIIDAQVNGRAGSRQLSGGNTRIVDALVMARLGEIAETLMQRPMHAVRILFFDKTPATNWAVPWHQDRAIAVRERRDVDGFERWTLKNGVDHVEPPVSVLEGMVALRLHVDPCPAENGALEVLPGSHRLGRLAATDVLAQARSGEPLKCPAGAGEVVVMRGLTIHASKAAKQPSHRRVLHIDYADCDLPGGLQWLM